ncbi:MAG: endonuclease III [bacterium]
MTRRPLSMDKKALSRIYSGLKRYFGKTQSPVVQFMEVRTLDPFRVLVATILSARTKDQTTTLVSERLFSKIKTLDELGTLSVKELETLIFPVGFYRTKARMLNRLPGVVQTLFGGVIPQTIEELVKLPGVGRKTANLVVTEAFDKQGICVDIHVHRISNRLGLLKTKTPAETETALRKLLPQKYWKTWNRYLVAFGQTLCTPLRPKCQGCPIYKDCARVGVIPPSSASRGAGLSKKVKAIARGQ